MRKRGPMPEFEKNFTVCHEQRVKIIFPDKTEVTCDFCPVTGSSYTDKKGVWLSNFAVFVPMKNVLKVKKVKK